MIVPDVTDFFFSKIIEGAESYFNPLGYMLVLCNSRHSQEKEIQYLRELSHRSVDGILLATPHQLPDEYSLKSGFLMTDQLFSSIGESIKETMAV